MHPGIPILSLEQPVGFVIADYALPQWNGLEALDLVRERDRDLPFILVSGRLGVSCASRKRPRKRLRACELKKFSVSPPFSLCG